MDKTKYHGFHIARSIEDQYTTYLGENNEFVISRDALLFRDQKQAEDYADSHDIRLGKVHNAIVPCKCFDFIRAEHPIAKV